MCGRRDAGSYMDKEERRVKKHNFLKVVLLAAVTLLACSGLARHEVQAAQKTKAAYTIRTYSKNYGVGKRVTGKYKYQLPVLKGNTAAVRKINASLKKGYKDSAENKKRMIEYIKSANKYNSPYGDRYFWTTTCKASYNRKGYVSFRFCHDWYAGGVHNGWTDGMTFNLKTGKKLNVSNVMPGNAYEVKWRIIDKFFEKYPGQNTDSARRGLYSKKISDFEFYLKNGNVVVSFGAYGPGGGNGEIKITFKGNYQ